MSTKIPIYCQCYGCQCHGTQIIAMLHVRDSGARVLELKTKRHGVWHRVVLALPILLGSSEAVDGEEDCKVAESLP